MSDLMQKLAVSRQIMDKHNQTPRNSNGSSLPMAENVNATYNVPQEMVQQPIPQQPTQQPTNLGQPVSENAINNSKLPEDIKKLMLENPIVQPQTNSPVLSNDIIEGASRLMNNNKTPNVSTTQNEGITTTTSLSPNNDLKQMIRDVVRDTVRDVVKEELSNAGLLSESSKKTNETLSLRVGNHIFEGKVLKIKKVKK
jgi:hypothetical protein